MVIGLSYFQQSDEKGKPLLSARSALAFDIFCQCFNAESFVHKPMKPGNIQEILDECFKAADYLMKENKMSKE